MKTFEYPFQNTPSIKITLVEIKAMEFDDYAESIEKVEGRFRAIIKEKDRVVSFTYYKGLLKLNNKIAIHANELMVIKENIIILCKNYSNIKTKWQSFIENPKLLAAAHMTAVATALMFMIKFYNILARYL